MKFSYCSVIVAALGIGIFGVCSSEAAAVTDTTTLAATEFVAAATTATTTTEETVFLAEVDKGVALLHDAESFQNRDNDSTACNKVAAINDHAETKSVDTATKTAHQDENQSSGFDLESATRVLAAETALELIEESTGLLLGSKVKAMLGRCEEKATSFKIYRKCISRGLNRLVNMGRIKLAVSTAIKNAVISDDRIKAMIESNLQPATMPTMPPTKLPTQAPVKPPTKIPTRAPANAPSKAPTIRPTRKPTISPVKPTTKSPTKKPTRAPAKPPTKSPTRLPTRPPIKPPTKAPTKAPIRSPTKAPTKTAPTTKAPTSAPTQLNCGQSIRRAWQDTSCEDRSAYLRAVELLYKLPAENSLGVPNFFDFTRIHANTNNSAYAHGANDGPFLPWHRWYLWKFEKALQIVSGTCVTVPYWDWTKDKGREMNATVLQPDSFGSSSGVNATDGCVIEGIASKNGFWTKTVRTGGCLKRGFVAKYASFSSETDIVRLIMNYPSFGRGLSGFSNNLQGAPHAVVHNFVSQHFASMHSPDDPLFMLHHCNIDRIWALYQDYYDQDRIDKLSLSDEEYSAGRGIGRDDPLPFTSGSGAFPQFFWTQEGRLPTPRDVHHSYGSVVQVTYANDYLGLLLSKLNTSYIAANNQSWVQLASGPVSEISCSRRLEVDVVAGNISISEVNDLLGIPEDIPPFQNITTRLIWDNLTLEGQSTHDALNTIAYRECEEQGNKILASPEWIAMHGMSPELFKCFNRGEPKDCSPKVEIVSSDNAFALEGNPIQILSYDKTSVTFALSQVWKAGVMDMVVLYYEDVNGMKQCVSAQDVFAGELGVYEAQCSGGFAKVIMYANDATIQEFAPMDWIMGPCSASGLSPAGTATYSATIPCSLKGAQCPLPSASDPLCDGTSELVVAIDTFDTSNNINSWVFSRSGENDELGAFLRPNLGTSKTYRVPFAANSVTVALEISELDCRRQNDVSVLINDEKVLLGMFGCSRRGNRKFRSGKVDVEVFNVADTVDKILMRIPPDMYEVDGRLTIGLRNSLIGVGSVTIVADCSNIIPIWKDPEVISIISQVSNP